MIRTIIKLQHSASLAARPTPLEMCISDLRFRMWTTLGSKWKPSPAGPCQYLPRKSSSYSPLRPTAPRRRARNRPKYCLASSVWMESHAVMNNFPLTKTLLQQQCLQIQTRMFLSQAGSLGGETGMQGARLLLAVAFIFAGCAPAFAVEGPTAAGPIGGTDIRSAVLPPPGLLAGFFSREPPLSISWTAMARQFRRFGMRTWLRKSRGLFFTPSPTPRSLAAPWVWGSWFPSETSAATFLSASRMTAPGELATLTWRSIGRAPLGSSGLRNFLAPFRSSKACQSSPDLV